MNLKQARFLRDVIIEKLGIHCTVPLGHGPDGYFARIVTVIGSQGKAEARDLKSIDDWNAYLEEREAYLKAKQEELDELEKRLKQKRRSPLEIMIDRACGLE